MQILKDISLKPYNTFGVEARAQSFVRLKNIADLSKITTFQKPLFLIGGGSNILFTKNVVDFLVVKVDFKGVEVLSETPEKITVRAYAGECWDDFVAWCVQNNYGGLENLSLIPGSVGAAPIQNIGAYGVSVADSIAQVNAYCLLKKTFENFSAEQCQFGYRDSIFKRRAKGEKIIVSVDFTLTKKNHTFYISYAPLQKWFEKSPDKTPDLVAVREAVITIRQSKLPDPKILGNGGSFFKNPVIKKEKLYALQKQYDVPYYPTNTPEKIKIPAGWLIEKTGWKGKRIGDVGIHEKQALVIVNYGKANGAEIVALSKEVQKSVAEKFGIFLEPEINIF